MLEYLAFEGGIPPMIFIITEDPVITHDHDLRCGFQLVEMIPEGLPVHAQVTCDTREINTGPGYNKCIDCSTVRVVENIL